MSVNKDAIHHTDSIRLPDQVQYLKIPPTVL